MQTLENSKHKSQNHNKLHSVKSAKRFLIAYLTWPAGRKTCPLGRLMLRSNELLRRVKTVHLLMNGRNYIRFWAEVKEKIENRG
jgi:hypothetical protein